MFHDVSVWSVGAKRRDTHKNTQTNHRLFKQNISNLLQQNLWIEIWMPSPTPSMYGIFTYIYHKNQPNVEKYTTHGWYAIFKDTNRFTNRFFRAKHRCLRTRLLSSKEWCFVVRWSRGIVLGSFNGYQLRSTYSTHRIHGTGISTYIWLIFMVNIGI